MLKKKRFRRLFEGVERVTPRVNFSWFEGCLTGANVIHASFYFSPCNPDSVLLWTAYLASTLNYLRLTTRVIEFNKNWFVIKRCLLFMLQNIVVFVSIAIVFSCICYGIYHGELMYCPAKSSEDLLVRSACQLQGRELSRYRVTFDTYQDSLFAFYAILDRGLWYNVLLLVIHSEELHYLYKLVLLGLVYAAIAFVTFLLRGVTLAVCYVSLEKFSSNRMDKNLTLSRAQVEWIQTEELFSEIRLLRKLPTPALKLSQWCLAIKESTIWVFIYYSIITVGFLINFAQ